MARYHLSKNGPRKCSAQIECPLQKKAIENGEDPSQIFHYPNKAAALEAYAEKLDAQHSGTNFDTLKKTSHKKTTDDQPMSITTENVVDQIPRGYLQERLFTGTKVSGHINVNELDENSYKEFGFHRWSRSELERRVFADRNERIRRRIDKGKVLYPTAILSRNDMKKLSMTEQGAVEYYSGISYMWVNELVFDKEKYDKMRDRMPEWGRNGEDSSFGSKMAFPRKEEIFKRKSENQNQVIPSHHQISKELTKRIVSELDTALMKNEKHQRVIYRGAGHDIVEDSNIPMEQWVAENRSIGTVVEYKGYSSATHNVAVTRSFSASMKTSRPDNIVYEILTPEGLAAESVSLHPDEEEILLPRDQHYAVVGYQHFKDVGNPHDKNSRKYDYHIVQMVAVDENNNVLDGTNSKLPKKFG